MVEERRSDCFVAALFCSTREKPRVLIDSNEVDKQLSFITIGLVCL